MCKDMNDMYINESQFDWKMAC